MTLCFLTELVQKPEVPGENLEKRSRYYYHNAMRIIKQLALILAFGFAGEIAAILFPIGLPASVVGLFLMLICLAAHLLKPEHLGETADYLSANMAFFFIPAVASVLGDYDAIRGVALKLVGICVVCTFVTFGVTYGTVRLFQTLVNKFIGNKFMMKNS
jgi:holin-like protein